MARNRGDKNKRPAMAAHQVRLPADLWERLTAAVGDRGRAEFIRRAVETALEPVEVRQRLTALEERLPPPTAPGPGPE